MECPRCAGAGRSLNSPGVYGEIEVCTVCGWPFAERDPKNAEYITIRLKREELESKELKRGNKGKKR
jgi:hypothetical protein